MSHVLTYSLTSAHLKVISPADQPIMNQGIVVLPQWKQDLMERQRQSRDQAAVKKDDIPAWKKQLNERRKSKPVKVETKVSF